MAMPAKPNEDTYAYLNLITGECAYFYLDGRLWSADKFNRINLMLPSLKNQQESL